MQNKPTSAKKFLFISFAILLLPNTALAVQSHGAPEGFYVHEIAHIIFILAMFYIWVNTRNREGNGWKYIRYSFILFIIWNIDALVIHWLTRTIPREQFITTYGHWSQVFIARSFTDLLFYFLKMDHLICVPAAFCFYYGLELLARDANDTKNGVK